MGDEITYGIDNVEPQGGSGGGNPAWEPFLQAVPQEYHEKVTPLLKEWDKGVNDRFQKIHSEYEPYKPFIGQHKPEEIQWGLTLAQAIASNPRQIFDALGEHHGYLKELTGQGQQEPNQEQEEVNPYAKDIETLKHQQDLIARAVLAREEQEQSKRAEAELDQEFTALKTTHGEFDEQYVSALMLSGLSGEQAVTTWKQKMASYAKAQEPRLNFLGAGGGIPGGSAPDVTKMSGVDRRKYALDLLTLANQQDRT